MSQLNSLVAIIAIVSLLAACQIRPSAAPDVQDNNNVEPAKEGEQKNVDMLDSGKNADDYVFAEDVVYYDGTTGYIARPNVDGTFPAVVMIHEWWGLNDNIKDMARQLAAEGYVVLAVDLYDGQVATDAAKAGELVSAVRQNPEPALKNLKAAVAYLRSQEDVIPEKVASLGWCFGGGMSLQLALTGTPLAATIIYYGSLETNATKLAAIKQPVLGIFGGKDTSIPLASVMEFNSTLGQIGTPRDIYVYPEVGHAFANPSGANYAPDETKDAWDKTLSFLEKNLKQ